MAEKIFRDILPRHGMAVREEQIALCHEVLDTLYNKEISLCEAGVNCTPFVRQYDILSNRWGDLLCQEENRTNDIRRNSRKWL